MHRVLEMNKSVNQEGCLFQICLRLLALFGPFLNERYL